MATFQGLFSFLANLLAGQLMPHAPTLSLLLCPVSFMSGHLVGSLQIEYPGRSARRSRWMRGQAAGLFITYGLMQMYKWPRTEALFASLRLCTERIGAKPHPHLRSTVMV